MKTNFVYLYSWNRCSGYNGCSKKWFYHKSFRSKSLALKYVISECLKLYSEGKSPEGLHFLIKCCSSPYDTDEFCKFFEFKVTSKGDIIYV